MESWTCTCGYENQVAGFKCLRCGKGADDLTPEQIAHIQRRRRAKKISKWVLLAIAILMIGLFIYDKALESYNETPPPPPLLDDEGVGTTAVP